MKRIQKNHFEFLTALFLIFGAIALRLLPHPPNFAPIAAIGLFSGCYLRRKWTWLIPLGAMLISDFFLGFYDWPVMASVYLSFGLIGLIGYYLRKRKNISTIIGSSLISSLLFFIITNLAVWGFSGMYNLSQAGLIKCFYLALPFFRNTLAGDLFYTTVLFGTWELAIYLVKNRLRLAGNEVDK